MTIQEHLQRVAEAKAKIGKTLRTDVPVMRETAKSYRLLEIERRQQAEEQRTLEEKEWQ